MPTFIPTILLWRRSANRARRHPRKAAPVKRGAIALVLD